jgi:hypothetical protein
MRDDYKITKPASEITIKIETQVIDILKSMELQTKFTVSELANTAIKRFITHHNDFLPTDMRDRQTKPNIER